MAKKYENKLSGSRKVVTEQIDGVWETRWFDGEKMIDNAYSNNKREAKETHERFVQSAHTLWS